MFLALPPCQLCKNRKLNFANGRRHGHTDCLEHFAAYALCFAAHRQVVAVFFYVSLLQRFQILLDMRPFEGMAGFFQVTLQLLAQNQSQKAAEDMPADGIIALMEDRTGFEHRLDISEHALNLPQLFLLQRDLVGGKLRIGAQHPFAVKARLVFHFSKSIEALSLSILTYRR
jgi:hypothetical protein